MGKLITGTFNGTGAALYVGIGFLPDFVNIFNLEDGALAQLRWSKNCISKEQEEGRLMYNGSTTDSGALLVVLANGAGVAPYYGGDKMTAASTAYLVKDDLDYSKNPKSGGTGVITKWTMDTPGSRTGHWDQGCDTTYVGEGSKMILRESVGNGKIYEVRITALSNDGNVANEVEISQNVGSGDVLALHRFVTFAGAASGTVIPAGFALNATAIINVSGELCFFEAGTYDN